MKSATALRKAKLEAPATLGTASDPDARGAHRGRGAPAQQTLEASLSRGPGDADLGRAPLNLRGKIRIVPWPLPVRKPPWPAARTDPLPVPSLLILDEIGYLPVIQGGGNLIAVGGEQPPSVAVCPRLDSSGRVRQMTKPSYSPPECTEVVWLSHDCHPRLAASSKQSSDWTILRCCRHRFHGPSRQSIRRHGRSPL